MNNERERSRRVCRRADGEEYKVFATLAALNAEPERARFSRSEVVDTRRKEREGAVRVQARFAELDALLALVRHLDDEDTLTRFVEENLGPSVHDQTRRGRAEQST